MKNNSLNSSRGCVYKLSVHIVFVTKYRRKVITAKILADLEKIFTRLCEGQKCKLVSFNGEEDHCHLLVDMYPDVAPSKLVNTLKTVSSRLIRRDYEEHLKRFYYNKPVLWTGAYCVISTGGAPLEIIKKYIESQDAPQ
jgi:putative transposase